MRIARAMKRFHDAVHASPARVQTSNDAVHASPAGVQTRPPPQTTAKLRIKKVKTRPKYMDWYKDLNKKPTKERVAPPDADDV